MNITELVMMLREKIYLILMKLIMQFWKLTENLVF